MKKYPNWAPSPLVDALNCIKGMNSNDWVLPDYFPDEKQPIDYFVGRGDITSTIEVLTKLTTHPKMKKVWADLESLTVNYYAATRGYPVFRGIMSCVLARQCLKAISESRKARVSKEAYVQRHKRIARAAKELANLMQEEGVVEETLLNVSRLFTEQQVRGIAERIEDQFSALGMYQSKEDLDRARRAVAEELTAEELAEEKEEEEKSRRLSTGIATPEEIDAYEEQFAADERKRNEDVDVWTKVLKDALERVPVRPAGWLLNLGNCAQIAADNPPAATPGHEGEKCAYAVAHILIYYFMAVLRKPLYATTSELVFVVTGRKKSAAAIKQRWMRWRKYESKPINLKVEFPPIYKGRGWQ